MTCTIMIMESNPYFSKVSSDDLKGFITFPFVWYLGKGSAIIPQFQFLTFHCKILGQKSGTVWVSEIRIASYFRTDRSMHLFDVLIPPTQQMSAHKYRSQPRISDYVCPPIPFSHISHFMIHCDCNWPITEGDHISPD